MRRRLILLTVMMMVAVSANAWEIEFRGGDLVTDGEDCTEAFNDAPAPWRFRDTVQCLAGGPDRFLFFARLPGDLTGTDRLMITVDFTQTAEDAGSLLELEFRARCIKPGFTRYQPSPAFTGSTVVLNLGGGGQWGRLQAVESPPFKPSGFGTGDCIEGGDLAIDVKPGPGTTANMSTLYFLRATAESVTP